MDSIRTSFTNRLLHIEARSTRVVQCNNDGRHPKHHRLRRTYLHTQWEAGDISLLPWIAMIGALALNILFYLSLTLFLGTMFSSRGAVVGIPIGFVFAGMFLGGVLPEGIAQLTPWAVVSPLAMELAEGAKDVTSYIPAIASAVWTAALVGASIWRFNREEF